MTLDRDGTQLDSRAGGDSLSIVVMEQRSGRYWLEFVAATAVGSVSGGLGREFDTSLAAIEALIARLRELASDPALTGLHLARVASRLLGVAPASAGPEGHP